MKQKRIIVRGKARLLVWRKGRIVANVKWSSNKQVTERRLRLALIKKKPVKPVIRVVKEVKPEKKKNWKQVWNIKLVYQSKRRGHDLLVELKVTTISSRPLTDYDVRELVRKGEFSDKVNKEGLPYVYNRVVIGLVSEEQTDESETVEVEEVHYSHKV
ncbi:MAG: hypothetical protein DRN12_05290 [Thermoplasmata archaeon]|nr:MAG: hypothetical protein DRN12_05290 [Thermoplasmata archaeon]